MNQIRHILIAIPEDWHDIVKAGLAKEQHKFVIITSREEALELMQTNSWDGLIIVAEWAISDLNSPSLIEEIQGTMPTVTIVTEESNKRFGFSQVIDKTYLAAMHGFCIAPFTVDELIAFFKRAIEAFEVRGDNSS